jgi:hypothetical protein
MTIYLGTKSHLLRTGAFFLFLLGALGFAHSALAQTTGVVRGYVFEKSTQLPLEQAVVKTTPNAGTTLTNKDGYFQLNQLPYGDYTLEVSMIGYQKITRKVTIRAGKVPSETFYLNEESTVLQDANVTAKRQESQGKVLTGQINLSAKSIQTFSIGGEPDLVRAVQVLPGVVSTGDQGGQLYIRGGAPIQNLVKLDGMILYNPFHSIGFFSVFETDILRSADIYTAGFNAQYGGRNSSVMDIKTRLGNRQRVAGKVSSSTYMSRALLEVPIGKKVDGLAPSSLLITAKKSYLDQTAGLFYPYVKTEFGGLPFTFTDLYGKYGFQAKNGSSANFFGFQFQDGTQLAADKAIGWTATGYGADLTIIPPSSATVIKAHFAQSDYAITSTEIAGRPRESSIDGFNAGLDFTYFMRKYDQLTYGLEFIGYSTRYQFTNGVGRILRQDDNSTEVAGYIQYRYQSGRWLVEPGFRVHNYGALGIVRAEPRFGLKYNATEYLRIKASGGMYSQNLVAANSDRDVVNLFYGFLSGAGDLPSMFDGQPVLSKLQTATHAVLGTEWNLTPRWSLEVEGYLKQFHRITNINRFKLYDDSDAYQDKPEILRKDFMVEKGNAMGLDFLVKYEDPHWYFWGTYSLGRVRRFDGQQWYAPHFDRRHNANAVVAYKWGEGKEMPWEFNLRWNLGTGFPFTPIRGYFQNQPFTTPAGTPDLAYDYARENGQLGILYGDLNSARLPVYHRLDATLKRVWKSGKFNRLEASLAATNVYNRANIFYYDAVKRKRVNQLPVMPTVMLSYAF